MKILLFAVLAVVALQSAEGFKKCPDKIPTGLPKAPKAGKYYQVMEEKRKHKAKCYNMNIAGSGKQLTIDQNMVSDDVNLKYTYVATANVNGTWDVTTKGEMKQRCS